MIDMKLKRFANFVKETSNQLQENNLPSHCSMVQP